MAEFLNLKELDHGLLTRLHRHPFKDYNQAKQDLIAIQNLKEERTDAEVIDEGLIAACVRKLGRFPLDATKNIYYRIYTENFQFPISPSAEYERNSKLAKTDSRRTEHTEVTPPSKESLAIYRSWVDDTQLYSPKRIYDLLELSYSYTTFRQSHNLPHLMTYRETIYVMLVLAYSGFYKLKQGSFETIKRKLSENSKHLFATGEHNTTYKTKIGRVYGNWTFTELISNSENTAGNANVLYKATCCSCGASDVINYRNFYKKCDNCKRLEAVGEIPESKRKFDKPVHIFLLRDGAVTVSVARPVDAVAIARVNFMNQAVYWEHYESRPKGFPREASMKDDSAEPKKDMMNLGDLSIKADNVLPVSDLHGF